MRYNLLFCDAKILHSQTMIKYIYSILLIVLLNPVFGQLRLDTLDWRSPVDIPILLSGNFAELRSNHFHAGIDIKTQSKVGFKIYAVQEGYISRIKVAPGGYGKAIYITHPDGYTSVYGHLKEYNIQLDKYVRSIQYAKHSYRVDIFPEKGELPVKKGDIIAISGNSGSSGGPHLHFEIRETSTARPQNGLFLGYDIDDTIAPKMYYLYAYPQGLNSTINGARNTKVFSLKKTNGKYRIKAQDTLKVRGEVAFGLKVNEYLNNSHNRCGVYKLNLFVNNELYMQQQYDSYSFAETRYINSLMDYEQNVNIKRKLYTLYREPNNKVSIIKQEVNRGIVTGQAGQIKKVDIEAIDAYGNKSELNFYVQFLQASKTQLARSNDKIVIPWQNSFVLDTNGFKVSFSAKTFYDTLFMTYKENPKRYPGTFSSVYTLHKRTVPVHKYFSIEVPCDSVDSTFYDKLILAQIVKKNYKAVGGLYVDGYLKAKVRSLGKYVVLIDTVPPTIKPLNGLADKTDVSGVSSIQFKIRDEFSGVMSYTATINGNWVLFEWDSKNRLITYNIDEYMPQEGFCELELKVYDGRGNETIFKKEFEVYPEPDHDIGQ